MQKLAKYGVGGMFFLLPLFFLLPPLANTFEMQMSGAKLMFVFGLGGALFSAYLAKNVHALLGLIHLAFTASVLFTGFGTIQLYPYVYWMAAVGVSLFFLELTEGSQKFALQCLVWAGVASSVLAFFQMMDMDPIMQYAPNITEAERTLPIGMLGQTTKFGALLAMLVGVALAIRDYPSALMMSFAAMATMSSFTWLALAGAVIVNFRYMFGRIITFSVVGMTAVIAGFFYLLKPASSILMDNGRFLVWQTTISAWLEHHPWLGFGPGAFGVLYHQHFQPASLAYGAFIQAHNDYVQVLFEFGVIGAVVMIACLAFILWYFYSYWFHVKQEKSEVVVACEAMLVAILLNAAGNFPFQLAPHFLLGTISFVILLRSTQGRDG